MKNKMPVLFLVLVFLFTGTAFAQMNGTYYIGSAGTAPGSTDPHFATLNAACDSVMTVGVGGDITFYITSDLTEPDNVDLAVNTGDYSITFKPYTGITPTVTYTQTADNSGSSGAWVIGTRNTSGAALVPTNNIIIDGSNTVDGTTRDLTFISSSGTNAYDFRIRGNNDNITIKNCIMSITTASYGIWVNSVDNAIPDSLTIENCSITANSTSAGTPVHVSYSGTITEAMEGLVVKDNDLFARTRGVFLNGNTNIALIEGNTVEVNQTASGYVSAAVMGNKIFSTGKTYILGNDFKVNATANTVAANGIRTIVASGGGTFIIANNFFHGYSGPDASGNASEMIGIRCGSPVEAYYNTFVMNDINATTGTLYRAINVAAGTPIIKNNIFVIEENDFPAYAISGAPTSDYNNYYLVGETNAKAHPSYATLADLQAVGMDLNSISKAVDLVSTTDLHLSGTSIGDLDLAGTPIVDITTDIDGDTRGAEYPYMGADEAGTALVPPVPCIFITELADPKNIYQARFIELFNNGTEDIDLGAGWKLNYYSNASTTPSAINLTGTIEAGTAFVIARDSTTFDTTYGFAADMAKSTYDSNGDDNVELLNPAGEVVDVFGVPGVDGTGTDHEFLDGKAVRKGTVSEGNPVYDASEWTIILNVNAPDGFDPAVWPTIIPVDISSAMSVGLKDIVVKYTQDLSAVNVANYSVIGSSVTFASASIDSEDPTKVILTASADIIGDAVLDTLIDAVNNDSVIFYIGITPIAFTNSTNPGGTIQDGYLATFNGIISANDAYNNVWVSDSENPYSGAMIFDYDFDASVAVGDMIILTAERDEYYNLTELASPVLLEIVSSDNTPYGPVEISGSDIDTSTAANTDPAEKWEGQLVKIVGAVVTSYSSSDYEYTCTDDAGTTYFRVGDNVNYHLSNVSMEVGKSYNIVGVVDYSYGEYRINPRGSDDIALYNIGPNPFSILNPADEAVFTSLADPGFVLMPMGEEGDSVKMLFVNWTDADDPNGDTLLYEMLFIGDGPEDTMATVDTFLYIPINEEEPYDMNGTYTYYFRATDPMGEIAYSDTQTITFDFPAPPKIVSSDIVLIDGTPTYYVKYDVPVAPLLANYKVIDHSDGSLIDPSAISGMSDYVTISATLEEDGWYSLISNNVESAADSLNESPVTRVDTTQACKVYIPFSANHPEDVTTIETFETNVGTFNQPYISGQSTVLNTSTFAVSDEEAYRGTKSGKLILNDNPETTGGWYVREYHGLTKTVKANSTLMFVVKGTNANVEMRLSIKDSGYEQSPWKSISLSDDWQIVSFDLANDVAEGWLTGNGTVEGTTVTFEGIHIRCSEDTDVVLYIDELTERQILNPVDITFNVMMHEWLRLSKFNLATDFVDIAGTMNDWGGTSMIMNDFDTDTTYSITIPLMPYSTQQFKFRINASWTDGMHEFDHNGPARELVVPTTAQSFTYWFNNDTLQTAIDGIPVEFALHQNYPNPFNPTTTINFDLPNNSDVSLIIYDITGHKVRTLVHGSNIEAGYKKIVWNGRDDFGNGVATGMYIYRLVAGDFVDVKKMTFLK